MSALTIGIDVGGTKIAAGVVADDGSIIARRSISTEAADPKAITAGITKVAQELQASAPTVVAVGVGAAGLVDIERGVVLSAPNLAWSNVALGPMLIDRVGLPVVVDNDANVAALGEARFGAGVGVADQIMVTVGTGIGGGYVFGGRVYRGAHGLGAEVGHMTIAGVEGPECGCGNRGCFEVMASGGSMGRRAREQGTAFSSGEEVGRAARDGDQVALAIVRETGTWLGIGLANLVNLLDPALIVIGGGASRDGELLIGPAREALAEHVMGRPARATPPVVAAALGPDAGLVGAAILAAERDR